MKPEKPTEESTDAADLRRRAQARLQSQTPPPKVPGSTDEMQRLFLELQVHQIELEMQNETLEESYARLEASAARYTNLYDFAPVSYFTLGLKGEIIQSNLAGARMLGLDRSRLLDRRFDAFVASADLPAFRTLLTKVFATQSPEATEVRLTIKDKPPLAVLLQACVSADGRESLASGDGTRGVQADHFHGLRAEGAVCGPAQCCGDQRWPGAVGFDERDSALEPRRNVAGLPGERHRCHGRWGRAARWTGPAPRRGPGAEIGLPAGEAIARHGQFRSRTRNRRPNPLQHPGGGGDYP